MMKKLHCLLVVITLSVSLFAQSREQITECNEKCRAGLTEQFVNEAKTNNLKLNMKQLVIISQSTSLTAFAPIEGLENSSEDRLIKATTVGMYYINSADKSRLNGAFRLQLSKIDKLPKEKSETSTIKAVLINSDGRIVKESIITKIGPISSSIIRPTACWVGGTHGLCFPANTSMLTVRFWALLCEDGCPIAP